MPPADFVYFRSGVPGSAASIEAGVRWLTSTKPQDRPGILLVGSLTCLEQPTHLHDMLTEATIRRLIEDGEGLVQGRPVRLLTEQGLVRQKKGLACDGPILAMWPTLRQLSLLTAKVGRSPVGVVVWNYDRDVAPLFDTPDEVFDGANEVQGARGRSNLRVANPTRGGGSY